MENERASAEARVLRLGDGEVMGAIEAVRDRFMVGGDESGGGFSLLQHLFPPRALAAPLHRHSREDEYSFVLEGHIGARLGDEEVFAEAGDLVFKPRGQWHTIWNAGDEPARVLEIISPGGFEKAFREMHALQDALDPEKMAAIAASYGCEADFERTSPLIEQHGLIF